MSSSPRVCLLIESYYPIIGGGEIQGQALVEGLLARGVQSVVVTLRTRPDLPPREQFQGYEVHRVGLGRSRWKGSSPAYRKLMELRAEYDLIYVAGFRVLGVPAVLLGKLRSKKVVLKAINNGELSGSYFDPGLRSVGLNHRSAAILPLNAMRKAILRRADHFVVMARNVQQECLEAGVPSGKISLIPDGIDLKRFRPRPPDEKVALREKLVLPPDATIVCFTGRLVTWKGAMVLLEAWRDVIVARRSLARGGEPADLLLMVGAGGTDSENCEAQARQFQAEHNLGSEIRFLGDVRNVEDYLGASDIYAFPTLNDLFPLTLLEAMATGLPPVTTRIGGLTDYVIPGENAMVVPPGDAGAVRDSLLPLLADPDLRGRLGRAALETARQFSIGSTIDRFLVLFQGLVRRSVERDPRIAGAHHGRE
jgi:glycosyltransferase involved in cell wall biosynthesis